MGKGLDGKGIPNGFIARMLRMGVRLKYGVSNFSIRHTSVSKVFHNRR